MFQATTPTLTIRFDESVDLSIARIIAVTFATSCHKIVAEYEKDIVIHDENNKLIIDGNEIRITFTQEDTLYFKPGKMLVQVNVLYFDGTRVASDIGTINWVKNLKNEVM